MGPLGLALGVQYVLPQSQNDENAGVRLHGLAVRIGAGLSSQRDRFHLGAWLGAGFDAIHVRPQQGSFGVATLTPARWTATSVLRVEGRAGWMVTQSLTLFLTPSLEWDPRKRAYTVTGVDGQAAVVAPYAIRPGLSLSLEWR
jgi:hypothetical protein